MTRIFLIFILCFVSAFAANRVGLLDAVSVHDGSSEHEFKGFLSFYYQTESMQVILLKDGVEVLEFEWSGRELRVMNIRNGSIMLELQMGDNDWGYFSLRKDEGRLFAVTDELGREILIGRDVDFDSIILSGRIYIANFLNDDKKITNRPRTRIP